MNTMNIIAQIKVAQTSADVDCILKEELCSLSDREALRKAVMDACMDPNVRAGGGIFRLARANRILNTPKRTNLVRVNDICDMDNRFIACSLIPFAGLWTNESENIEKLKEFSTLEERELFIAEINCQAIRDGVEISTVSSCAMISEFRELYLDEAMYYLRIENDSGVASGSPAGDVQEEPDWFFDNFAFGFLWNPGTEHLKQLSVLSTFEERAEYVRTVNQTAYEVCGGYLMPDRERLYMEDLRQYREDGRLSEFKTLFQHDAELRALYAD